MTARSAAVVTARQARRRPEELHGNRVLAERIRPVLASLADPRWARRPRALSGTGRARCWRWRGPCWTRWPGDQAGRPGAGARGGADRCCSDAGLDGELTGAARRSAIRLVSLLSAAVERAEGSAPQDATGSAHLLRPSARRAAAAALRSVRRQVRWDSPVLRHAVRLSAVAAVGYLIGTALPLGHGYWAPWPR